jgi:hypothetical protein
MDLAGDSDGWVSLAELRAWIAHTQQRHIRDSVSAAWHTYDTDRDGRVGWEELRNATYGHCEPGMPTSPLPFDLAFRILSLIPSLHFKCHLLFLLKSNLCDKLTGDFTFVAGILNV